MPDRTVKIAVMVETTRSFSRGLLRAIARFARNQGNWQLVLHEHTREPGVPGWLRDWKGDGLLTRVYDPELAGFLATRPFPVINLAGSISHPNLPEVQPDAAILARVAVDFFTQAAFTRFAFCGYPGIWFSDRLEAALAAVLAERKWSPAIYRAPDHRVVADLGRREAFSAEGSPELADWVGTLPKHTAVITCNDMRGLQLLLSIRAAGRSVPEDLAVLGMGDESVICELCQPALSSVRHDTETLANQACQWLADRLAGHGGSSGPAAAQHVHVHERSTTDSIASDDPVLVKALRFIRSRAHTGIESREVLDHVQRSRNTVESRFRMAIGRSIAAEIRRCRIERARILLDQTALTHQQIALACGFATAPHFSRLFKNQTGRTPGAYRLARFGAE